MVMCVKLTTIMGLKKFSKDYLKPDNKIELIFFIFMICAVVTFFGAIFLAKFFGR